MPDTSVPTRPAALRPSVLALGPHRFDVTHRAVVVGVITPTPEAGERTGPWSVDALLATARTLVHDGADILEVGTLDDVTQDEELDRLLPVVEALRSRFDLPLCIDSGRSAVARAGFSAGAVLGRDRRGGADPDYLRAVAELGVAIVLTAPRPGGAGADPGERSDVDDIVGMVRATLVDHLAQAEAAGIARDQMLIEAGLFAGPTLASPAGVMAPWSLRLLRASDVFADLGYPFVVSVEAGYPVDAEHAGGEHAERVRYDTMAAHALAIGRGCRVVRAHDVRSARRVVDTMAAILGAP